MVVVAQIQVRGSAKVDFVRRRVLSPGLCGFIRVCKIWLVGFDLDAVIFGRSIGFGASMGRHDTYYPRAMGDIIRITRAQWAT
jgi:hypothetical protein